VTGQNSYTVISLEALEQVEIEEMYEFYGYCNDLLVKLNVAGMRVVDVLRQAVYDDEESHIDYRTYIPKVSGMLARNALWRLWAKYVVRERHPVAILAGVAALAGVAGVVSLLKACHRPRWRGVAPRDAGDAVRGLRCSLSWPSTTNTTTTSTARPSGNRSRTHPDNR